ncbi:MAG: PEP-CTERM sorting domain-containing protein [Rhodopila sp.]|nr:PEP-CTERM sorting domain-containing protein [Rhodopila sp.]
MTPFKLAAILATLAGGVAPAHSAVVTVVNPTTFGGFESNVENPTGAPATWAQPQVSQWAPSPNFAAANLAIVNDGDAYTGETYTWSGGNYAGVYDGYVTTTSGSAWQYIGLQNLAVQAGATINVQAYVWANAVGDQFGISYGTTGQVSVTQKPTDTYAFTPTDIYVTQSYVPVNFSFVAPSSNIDIDFGFYDPENTAPIHIDDVSVTYETTGSVPEPASAALLGAALLGLGLTRRRFG